MVESVQVDHQTERAQECPLHRTRELECQEFDSETLVMDAIADCVHVLSASMGTIWKLCDGTRSAGQIAKGLAETFDCSQVDDLGRTVEESLETLDSLNLLVGSYVGKTESVDRSDSSRNTASGRS